MRTRGTATTPRRLQVQRLGKDPIPEGKGGATLTPQFPPTWLVKGLWYRSAPSGLAAYLMGVGAIQRHRKRWKENPAWSRRTLTRLYWLMWIAWKMWITRLWLVSNSCLTFRKPFWPAEQQCHVHCTIKNFQSCWAWHVHCIVLCSGSYKTLTVSCCHHAAPVHTKGQKIILSHQPNTDFHKVLLYTDNPWWMHI